ncbi:hypothetical protein D3C79_946420 [compost metagenome]
MGGVQVIRHLVPACGAGQAATDATDAVGWVTHGAHQGLGLLGGFDHGDHQCLRADVQQLLDQIGVAIHGAHDGCGGVGRHGLQLREYARYGVWRVFTVDQHPVITGGGDDLGGVAGGEPGPDAILGR